MAVVIGSVNCAENFQKVAIIGSSVGDPIPEGLGCLTENDLDTVDAGSVALFYEPALSAEDPAAAPAAYTTKDASNTLITVPMNNFFDSAKRIFSAVGNSLPYDKAATELTKQANASATQNAKVELACLANEGTSKSDVDVTANNVIDVALSDIISIKNTGASPKIAVCSPDFYALLVKAAGDALKSVEANERWLNASVGRFLDTYWVSSPILALENATYYDSTGTKRVVPLTGTAYIMWDGTKFVAVNRINEFSIKDGGASFSGVAACMSSMLGVKLIEPKACVVRKMSISG